MITTTTVRRTPVDLDRRTARLLMWGSVAAIGIIGTAPALAER